MLDGNEREGISPERVARTIVDAIEEDAPASLYAVGQQRPHGLRPATCPPPRPRSSVSSAGMLRRPQQRHRPTGGSTCAPAARRPGLPQPPLGGAREPSGRAGWRTDCGAGATVLDIGCGWGELSLRVAAAAPQAQVVGVDLDEPSLEEARQPRPRARPRRAHARSSRATAPITGPDEVDALVAIGASQVWGPDVEEKQPLDYASALSGMRERVRLGGRVVYGDAHLVPLPHPGGHAPSPGATTSSSPSPSWSTSPSSTGSPRSPYRRRAWTSGTRSSPASPRATPPGWPRTTPTTPTRPRSAQRAARQRDAYFRGYRGDPRAGVPPAARCVRLATIARVTSLRRLLRCSSLVPLLALAAGCGDDEPRRRRPRTPSAPTPRAVRPRRRSDLPPGNPEPRTPRRR